MGIKMRGFTLLEILIALFIFAIVSLLLAQALRTVISAQNETEKVAEQLAQTQMALLFFSRDLEQAIDRPVSSPQGEVEGAFLGDVETLRLTHSGFSNPNAHLARSHLQRSAYRFEKGALLRDTFEVLDQSPSSRPQTRVLLSGIQALQFSYLDFNNVFHQAWEANGGNSQASADRRPENALTDDLEAKANSSKKLPRAVKLTIRFKKGGTLEQLYLLPQQEVPHEIH